MKSIAGAPGTRFGLFLRIAQCFFATASIASVATTRSFYMYTAFCYLIASMGLQAIWSFGLALMDVYALLRKRVLHNPVLVSLFVVGDWVTATLSLAAAASAGGVTVLYFGDLGGCNLGAECTNYQMAVALAFLSWIAIDISFVVMLWLLASGSRGAKHVIPRSISGRRWNILPHRDVAIAGKHRKLVYL